MKRVSERLEQQLHSRKREFEKKLEETEDRLYLLHDDVENMKRVNEKLERENHDLKKQVDTFIAKEDRTIQQYEKIIEQLKAEVKDKERQCHTIEVREAFARQELAIKLKELQFKVECN